MKLIGITGKARSGKDTIAEILFEHYGFTRIAFADPVKLAAQQIFGLSHDQTWDDNLKEVVIPYWDLTPRQMFQKVGDAAKAQFGDGVWMKRWYLGYDMLKDSDDIVVPDCRYDLEASGVRGLGGIIVRVVRPEEGLDGNVGLHSSESGLSLAVDYTINNSGTLDDLRHQVAKIIQLIEVAG